MQKRNAEKIDRWAEILRHSAVALTPIDHADPQARLSIAAGKHRVWIVACLNAIDAHRTGTKIAYDAPLRQFVFPAPASMGAKVAESVWQAYLQYVLGSVESAEWLGEAVRSLNPTALTAGIDDNPEPWWANELLILHALQSFVTLSGSIELQASLDRCVDFHLAEIQPDHATNEPWAIHAFAGHESGDTSAGALLHAAMVQGGGSLTPVARLIIRDALYCLGK